jgi:hypothetical protein
VFSLQVSAMVAKPWSPAVPVPELLVARTLKRYAVPAARPLTLAVTAVVLLPLGVGEQAFEPAPLNPVAPKAASVTHSK